MFIGLSSDDLRYLATQIESGALGSPYREFALSKVGIARPRLAADLETLASQGFTPALLARLLRAVATERGRIERPNTQLELVATGLEAQAQARDTLVVVEQLFAEATDSVLIVGFAVFHGNEIFKTLAKRMMDLVDLRVVCCFDVARDRGDNRPERVIIDDFARRFVKYQWPGSRVPEIYFDRRSLSADREKRAVLHAKTIVIDRRKALLTSANPTPAAYLRNIELGIVVSGGDIPHEIDSYFRNLIADGRLERLPL